MRKRRRYIISSLLILIIICLIIFYKNSILISLGEYLITEYPLVRADAIAVLSGSIPDRILEAIDIYKGGYASLIILTMAEKPPGYNALLNLGLKIPEEHDLNKMTAIKLGIPSSSIIVIRKRGNSTYSEMQVLYDFLARKNLGSVILVTSKSHTTRATKLFNLANGGEKIKVITRPTNYDSFDPKNWWKARRDWKQVIFEYQKLAHYYLYFMLTALSN